MPLRAAPRMHCMRLRAAFCVCTATALQLAKQQRFVQPRLSQPTMSLQPLMQQLGRTTLGTAVAYKIAKGGHKRGSLNRDGAVAAFTVAALAFSCSFRSGVTLLCFYKTGSMLTKYGAAVKQKLEDD
jgi:cation transport ATPase